MARLLLITCVLACWLCPSSARGDRITGKPDLLAVSGHYGSAVAVGKRGGIYVYNKRKKAWRREQVSETADLVAAHMAYRRDIWALAANGRVLRWRYGNWILVPGVDKASYRGFAMAGLRRGVVVGTGGAVFHLVSERWSKFHANPLKSDLYAVARVGSGGRERFVAVGKGGAALALGGVGRSLTSDIEISRSKHDLVAIAACRGYRAEAVAVGRDVVVRSHSDGTWRKLSTAPTGHPLTSVAVRCRRRSRADTVYATMGQSIVWLDVKTGTWYNHAVRGISSLRAITWLDRRRLIAVGDAGSVVIVSAKTLDKEAADIARKQAARLRLPRYPGAKKMCDGRVYVRRVRGHITWERFTTADSRAKVQAFFKAKLGNSHLTSRRRSDIWRYPRKKPTKVLSVSPVSRLRNRRDCKPPADAKTIIEYSEFPR